jgi:hypothetical protein
MRFQSLRFQQFAGIQVGHQHIPALELPAAADVGVFFI